VGGDGSAGVVLADLNQDGLLDLAVAGSHSNAVAVFLGTLDGGFVPSAFFANPIVASSLMGIAAGDANGDGFQDLVVATVLGGQDASLLATWSAALLRLSMPSGTEAPICHRGWPEHDVSTDKSSRWTECRPLCLAGEPLCSYSGR
jgi:hypothetical protein